MHNVSLVIRQQHDKSNLRRAVGIIGECRVDKNDKAYPGSVEFGEREASVLVCQLPVDTLVELPYIVGPGVDSLRRKRVVACGLGLTIR